jgi:glycosyltransferase involved in cell wall biosynthesis
MNILFVSDVSIKDIIGGAERVLSEQSSRLARKGHKVFVITRKLPLHPNHYELINDVHEFRYEIFRQNSLSFIVSSILNSRKIFLDLLKTEAVDLINFHQPFSALGVILSSKSRQMAKVYSCHSFSFEEYETRHLKPSKIFSKINYRVNSYARKCIERYIINKSDSVIVLSEFTRNKIIGNYGINSGKIHVIPGGVDLSKFGYVGNKLAAKNRLGLAEDKIVIFTIRNLVPRMGLENLIQAMKEIVKSTEDIFLVIGGEGELRLKLSNMISELKLENFVQLNGFIPEEELPSYYQAADFFILPTEYLEGFGLVTLEAMACGTPVLGTPVGGTEEILGKFDSSFLFKDTKSESLATLIMDKVKYYKDEPEEYQKLSRRCRAFVEKNYSWDANVDKNEALFIPLIKKGK